MFSRFRSGTPAFHCMTWIICVASILFAACSSNPTIATEQKHYIEPPRQEKIAASTTSLRVCADPNNLPFSNKNNEGFENKIARLIADDMHVPVEYTWWAQRRGFFRNTLRAGLCDVVIGVPASFELAATTQPYYRSTYVFVTRRDRHIDITSLDDPRLKDLRIGVQLVGDDGANSPPVHALNNRGMVDNLKGYTLYGDYSEDNPPARVVDAVVKRDVDIAVVWGPLGGYFAERHPGVLSIRPVTPEIDLPYLPFVYDISIGVRRGEDEFKTRIDEILERRRDDIGKILDEYGVPRVDEKSVADIGSRNDQVGFGDMSSRRARIQFGRVEPLREWIQFSDVLGPRSDQMHLAVGLSPRYTDKMVPPRQRRMNVTRPFFQSPLTRLSELIDQDRGLRPTAKRMLPLTRPRKASEVTL